MYTAGMFGASCFDFLPRPNTTTNRINKIVHPAIAAAWRQQITAHTAIGIVWN